jgi:hypothetical protein
MHLLVQLINKNYIKKLIILYLIKNLKKYGHLEVKLNYIQERLIKLKFIRKDKCKKCTVGDYKKLNNKNNQCAHYSPFKKTINTTKIKK